MNGITGLAFMLHDQQKSEVEVIHYLQRYELCTEKEARQTISFISDHFIAHYIFTYYVGYELLEKLFKLTWTVISTSGE